MELISPGMGLVFWSVIAFSIVLYILKKFAWKPILEAIKVREERIDESLRSAEKIKQEYEELDEFREKEIAAIDTEKQNILSAAKSTAEEIIKQAQLKAVQDSEKIIADARKAIEAERKLALAEIKQQVAMLSLDMAERVLQEEFADKSKQVQYINKLLDDFNLN